MGQRLSGRTALITGSTSGIGAAIAMAYAREGARVVVTGRDADRGTAVAGAIQTSGGWAAFVPGDLASGDTAVRRLVSGAQDALGASIGILVNNAAFLVGGRPTLQTDAGLIERTLGLNIVVPFLLTAAVIPAMLEAGQGVVINIGSVNGVVGMGGAALYGASKAGLHSLTKSWAAEFGPHGVRVNTLAPGPTLTEGMAPVEDALHRLTAATPAGRPGRPEDVAAAAVFLACDDALHIHGTTLFVDGGFTS